MKSKNVLKSKKLLMLGTSYASCEIVAYAKSLGVYTIVTDFQPPEISTAKLLSDEFWMINTGDIDTLECKCREEHVTAVMCGISEFNLEVCMELCRRLDLPCYCTPEAWHYSRNKSDFKKLCRKVGAPVPEDYCITDDLSKDELSKIKYPVVVKPVDMSGNRGISYCFSQSELINAYKLARNLSKNPNIIVERMLKGKEWYSYYAIANGQMRQICLNAMEAEPNQLKNLYSLTTNITDKVERFNTEINPKIEDVLKKVGCKEGIAWVQVMLDEDDQFYIIEMGYRLPGDLPDKTYPLLCNFDAIKWLTDYSLGHIHTENELPVAQLHSYKKCVCGYSLWTHKGGILTRFIGIDAINSIAGVKFYTIHHIGENFVAHRPLAVITVIADDCEDFCEKLKKINKLISIEDENGEDVVIRYTDFDYLKNAYKRGI